MLLPWETSRGCGELIESIVRGTDSAWSIGFDSGTIDPFMLFEILGSS